MKLQCAQSDVVITTAQLFGRAAPVIINDDILDAMKPGSVIVDLAAETGGNVVGSLSGEIIRKGNVSIVGASNFAGRYARDASQMYASNLYGFFSEFYSPGNQALSFDPSDEILAACYLVREGVVIHPSFNKSI
jgi:NAD(P) transhydrogenase subunit alpha